MRRLDSTTRRSLCIWRSFTSLVVEVIFFFSPPVFLTCFAWGDFISTRVKKSTSRKEASKQARRKEMRKVKGFGTVGSVADLDAPTCSTTTSPIPTDGHTLKRTCMRHGHHVHPSHHVHPRMHPQTHTHRGCMYVHLGMQHMITMLGPRHPSRKTSIRRAIGYP